MSWHLRPSRRGLFLLLASAVLGAAALPDSLAANGAVRDLPVLALPHGTASISASSCSRACKFCSRATRCAATCRATGS